MYTRASPQAADLAGFRLLSSHLTCRLSQHAVNYTYVVVILASPTFITHLNASHLG